MKSRRLSPTLLLLAVFACSSPPAPLEPESETIRSGWNLRAYSGAFAGYRPMDEAVAAAESAAGRAEDRLERRLGLVLDPERARIIEFADDVNEARLRTRVIDGRSVQVITLPAAPIAQGRHGPEELLTLALAHAALADYGTEGLPDWYVKGAPIWVSDTLDRSLYERMLGGPTAVLDPDRLVPPIALDGDRNDSLASAYFFRFLAEEFGAARLPGLSRALTGSRDPAAPLAAALGTDPASLPVAFDGFRLRSVSGLVEDPHVRELTAARRLSAADRVVRLSGIAPRAASRFVAAAILEELGVAQFEAGDPGAAAVTLAHVERDYGREALQPDRDRYTFALTFDRAGEPEAAALRLSGFLSEFPGSRFAPAALDRLAAIELAAGRGEEAMRRYAEVVERYPESAEFEEACLKLAADCAARHLYARAADYLERTGPSAAADRRLAEMAAVLSGDVAPPGSPEVARDAFEALASPNEAVAEEGTATLIGMGPVARGPVASALASSAPGASDPGLRTRLVRVYTAWADEEQLAVMLGDEDPLVADAAISGLVTLGVPGNRLRSMIDSRPEPAEAAREAWRRRFGREESLPEVRGLLSSPDHRERAEAATALSTIDRPEAFEALVDLARDESPQVRRAAAASIGIRSEDAVGDALVSLLDDPSPLVRVEAIRALARRGTLDAIREAAEDDGDPRVRLEAARLLYASEPADPAEREREMVLLVRMLQDPDALVRRGLESMLRAVTADRALVLALASELDAAETPGYAMRIIRVIAHIAPTDFGYDPAGGGDERERVAAAFLEWWQQVDR